MVDGLRLGRAVFGGRRLRALTVVDAFMREALAIYVDQGIKGEQVVAAMARIASSRAAPRTIRVDNGPDFIHFGLYDCVRPHSSLGGRTPNDI